MSDYAIRNEDEVAGPSGAGNYTQPVDSTDADYTVTTEAELEDTLNNKVSGGEVVWVPMGESIQVNIPNPNTYEGSYSPAIEVPSNVTVASLRDGNSNPGRIYTNDVPDNGGKSILGLRGDSRLVGLELHGAGDTGDGWVVNAGGASYWSVENCEIHDMGRGGVDSNGGGYVHHNHIYNFSRGGLGYGATTGVDSTWTRIYHNQFDSCRHAVAGHQNAHGEVRDNLFTDTQTDHFTIDKHDPGGDYHVHHNELRIDDRTNVQFQDGPPDNALIEWNWSYNDNTPGDCADAVERWVCVDGGDLSNVTIQDNWLGTSEPPSSGTTVYPPPASMTAGASTAGAGTQTGDVASADVAGTNTNVLDPGVVGVSYNLLELIAPSDMNYDRVEYEFLVAGDVNLTSALETSSDEKTDNEDGTTTVYGRLNDGFADSWLIEARGILRYELRDLDTGDVITDSTLDYRWNGQDRTMESLIIPESEKEAVQFKPADGSPVFKQYKAVQIDREHGMQDTASVVMDRQVLNTVDPAEGLDEMYITDQYGEYEFGGIVRDIERQGSDTATVLLDSFERLAREAKPLPARTSFTNVDDSTVIRDAIGRVTGLSDGDIDTIKTGLDFTFSHVSPAKQMRIVRNVTKGRLVFNPDGTVDYLETIGEDKT